MEVACLPISRFGGPAKLGALASDAVLLELDAVPLELDAVLLELGP